MAFSKFSLEIEMGNDEMQTTDDLIDALKAVQIGLAHGHTDKRIRDINGNTVGHFLLS